MCDMKAFEFMVYLSQAWQREGFEGILQLSPTMKGGYSGAGAGLFWEAHGKKQEATDTSYSKILLAHKEFFFTLRVG